MYTVIMTLNFIKTEMGKTYRYDPDTFGHKFERRGKASKFKKSILDLRLKRRRKIQDQEDLLRDDTELNLKEYLNG